MKIIYILSEASVIIAVVSTVTINNLKASQGEIKIQNTAEESIHRGGDENNSKNTCPFALLHFLRFALDVGSSGAFFPKLEPMREPRWFPVNLM